MRNAELATDGGGGGGGGGGGDQLTGEGVSRNFHLCLCVVCIIWDFVVMFCKHILQRPVGLQIMSKHALAYTILSRQ